MTNPSILLKDGSEIPEGIMDAFITSLCSLHDVKSKKNSKHGSIMIVKPKQHGPEECEFTNLLFSKVVELLKYRQDLPSLFLINLIVLRRHLFDDSALRAK